jgi:methionyl-tRNA formyltransferase|tara:strand:- start:2253 stop:3029 length:777 start_codon:yes stop_codon:yes gene_type:complete
MNITIVTNRDLASHIALTRLVKGLSGHRLAIFLSEKVGGDQPLAQPLVALAAFEKNFLEDGRPSFDQLAVAAGCSIQGFSDIGNQINSPAGVARIQATEPELIISLRFGLIIRDEVIAIPRHGLINLHSGRLPDYRGVMATFRAMLNGDAEIASTLHFIQDSGVDTGDIISTRPIPVVADKSYLFNVLNLYAGGCDQILQAVAAVDAGQPLTAEPQQGSAGYFSFPTEDELAAFFARGQQLFDGTDRAVENSPLHKYK